MVYVNVLSLQLYDITEGQHENPLSGQLCGPRIKLETSQMKDRRQLYLFDSHEYFTGLNIGL